MPLNTHSLRDEAAVAVSTVRKKSGTGSKPRVLAADNKTRKLAGQSSKTPATKSDDVLKLLRASKGASVNELMKATGWQSHSVRGFLSGTVRKKLGLTLTSEGGKDGVRRYRITDAAKAG